jgi:myosin-light-chain kinase
MTASGAMEHTWLCDPTVADAALSLSKRKLKRYVIKKRWAKAVNMIVALRRMGAKLDI